MTMQRQFLSQPVVPLEPNVGEAPNAGFDFNSFLRLLILHYRLILGTVITVVAITLINVVNTPPQYDATALVLIDQRENKVMDPNSVLTGLTLDPVTVDNQLQILQSRDLMAQVIDNLGLLKRPPAVVPPRPIATIEGYLKPTNWFGHRVATKQVATTAQRREELIGDLLGGESVSSVEMSTALQI